MSSGLATSLSSSVCGELGHGALGEVAAVGATCHSSWASTRTAPARRSRASGLGKTPTTSVRRLTSLLSRSSGLVDQIFFQCATGKAVKASRSSLGAAQHLLDLGQLLAEHRGDHLELLVDVLGVGLGEDRADRRGDHLRVALGHHGEDVAHEVHPAPLPGGPEQHRADRGLQAGVGVGDDQLDPAQPAGLQRAQERGPERPVLAVADVEPEDLTPPVGGRPRWRSRPPGRPPAG